MTTAQYVATIDRLRTRAFPTRRGWSDTGPGGPGYHLAALITRDTLLGRGGTSAPEAQAEDQFGADYEALVAVLDARWGEAQAFSLWSMLTRRMEGEEIPEPWDELCTTMSSLHLWRAEERWIAVGAVHGSQEHEAQLVAAVTDVDPP
ncbi:MULTISPECIES: hypothetical protein [unclassified Streptomyces]|uniref:hypothetical protein n=1 Tax=unclassified Streptomyces TaxID=2593676 RepID=UPI002E1235AC|nr:hypothetical protein OG452_31375 [Streptomyces sp. NBC_01197]WSS47780.1 hypothetical protein OG708_03490 [Streptomyces sp. NBC_01180]